MSAAPVMTSAAPAITAQDLELEHAELLPARETLWITRLYPRYNPGGLMIHYHPDPPVHVAQYDAWLSSVSGAPQAWWSRRQELPPSGPSRAGRVLLAARLGDSMTREEASRTVTFDSSFQEGCPAALTTWGLHRLAGSAKEPGASRDQSPRRPQPC